MDYKYLSENVLTTQALIDSVKEQTGYELDNLMGLQPFLRADRSGQYKLVILLLRKTDTKGAFIPTQVLSCDVATGTLINRERAEKFFASLHPGVEQPIFVARKNIDKEMSKQYKANIFPLMDKLRMEVIERGETDPDTYMEYLKCVLYGFSDEFAQVLLKISRTYMTARRIKVECFDCHGSFTVETKNLINGQIISNQCPFCQAYIKTEYKRNGKCATYTDLYMEEYRTKAADVSVKAPAPSDTVMENILDNQGTFVVEESLKSKSVPQDNAPTPAHQPTTAPSPAAVVAEVEEADETEALITEMVSAQVQETEDTPIPADSLPSEENETDYNPHYLNNVDEDALFDLSHQKKAFSVARYMIFETETDAPAMVMTLNGEKGCGIYSSIIHLSGFSINQMKFMDIETATSEDFKTDKPCIVLSVKEGTQKTYPFLKEAVLAMKNKRGLALFITGTAPALKSLMEKNPYLESKVVYDLIYKPYAVSTLKNIFTNRMESYGIDTSALTDADAQKLFANKNALQVAKLCAKMYFKHLMAVAENRNGIEEEYLSEQEIKAELPKTTTNV